MSDRRQRASTFARDALTLSFGAVFAQALGLIVVPLLARLYAPEAFGLLALFGSISGTIAVISCLRYEMSIMLPETDEEAANLLVLSIALSALVGLATIPLLWFGRPWILKWLDAPELAPYLWMAPPTIFFGGAFLALNYWVSRGRRFGRLSFARVLSSVVMSAVQLGSALAGFATAGGLIAGSVISHGAATGYLGGASLREEGRVLLKSVTWRGIMAGMSRHRKFPLFSTWATLLNTVSWQLPAFLLAAFFSTTVVGFYALGTRLLRVPMDLVGRAIGQVFYQRAAEARTEGTLPELVTGVFRRLVLFGMFPMLVLSVIGRDLFVIVMGNDWAEAGVYSQILAVWMFFWFTASPLSLLYSVLERQESSLVVNVVIFTTRLGSLVVGGWYGNARLALALFALTGIVVYGGQSLWIMNQAGVPWTRLLGILLANAAVTVPAVLALAAFCRVWPSEWAALGAAALLTLAYGLYVLKKDPHVRDMALENPLIGGIVRCSLRAPIWSKSYRL